MQKTYVFFVVNQSEPGAARALFVLYSVMRSKIMGWKMYNVDVAAGNMISRRESFAGRDPANSGFRYAFAAPGYSAVFDSVKSISTLKKNDLCVYIEGARFSDAQVKMILDGDQLDAPHRA
jgi:hypothetical protein